MLSAQVVQKGTFEMSPEAGITENRPTSSLLSFEGRGGDRSKRWNALIDLDHPAKNSSDLVGMLGLFGISPSQINTVILTHLHPDHIGHKELFPDALYIFHQDEKLSFYFKENHTFKLEGDAIYNLSDDGPPRLIDYEPDLRALGDNLYIRHCPGHTKGSLVIFACIDQRVYAFAGDIVLNRDHYDRWQPPGMSWDQERIFEHMGYIKERADVIVPGHGAPFVNSNLAVA